MATLTGATYQITMCFLLKNCCQASHICLTPELLTVLEYCTAPHCTALHTQQIVGFLFYNVGVLTVEQFPCVQAVVIRTEFESISRVLRYIFRASLYFNIFFLIHFYIFISIIFYIVMLMWFVPLLLVLIVLKYTLYSL